MTQSKHVSASESLSVLVVDDFEMIRESLRALLTSEGHRVTLASDAKEATQLISAMEFDAAVIDYEMPGPDGLMLLQTIQEKYPLLPVIVVAGALDSTRAIELANAGVFKVAQKPVNSGWLLNALNEATPVNEMRRRAAYWSARLTEKPAPVHSESEPQRKQEQINA